MEITREEEKRFRFWHLFPLLWPLMKWRWKLSEILINWKRMRNVCAHTGPASGTPQIALQGAEVVGTLTRSEFFFLDEKFIIFTLWQSKWDSDNSQLIQFDMPSVLLTGTKLCCSQLHGEKKQTGGEALFPLHPCHVGGWCLFIWIHSTQPKSHLGRARWEFWVSYRTVQERPGGFGSLAGK